MTLDSEVVACENREKVDSCFAAIAFLVNLLAGLIAYSYHPKKPALDLNDKGLAALPQAVFWR